MFGGKLGVPELLIILGIALLFFGPGKLGDLGKGVGDAIRNLKGALKEIEPPKPTTSQVTAATQTPDQPPSR